MTQNKLSRRDFLKSAGLTAAGVALAACTPAAPAAPAQPAAAEAEAEEKPAAAATGPVKITWWNQYSTATVKEMIPKIVEQFQNEYKDITVEYELTGGPPGGGNYDEVLLSRIAGGNAPDSATLFSPPVPFAARGSLLAIDEMMAGAKWAKPGAFYEAPHKSCQWQGKSYGLASSAGPGSMFLSVPQFQAKGISTKREDFPKTWDDLKALSAEFVVWEKDELKQAGFMPWATSWLRPAWSGLNGGQLYDSANNRYALDSQENITWLDYMVKWLDEQYQGDIEKVNLYGNWEGTYPNTAFNLGKAALAQEGSWSTTDAEIPFEWEVAKFPTGPSGKTSVTGFWPNWFVIPQGSPHAQEAFLFIEYFATKGWETWYLYIMDLPSWKDFPADVLTTKLVDAAGADRAKDIHLFYTDYLKDAVEMWTSPIDSFAGETMAAAMDEVMHKVKTPAEALQEAQKLCQSKLEETLKGA
jgi:multiple sugar transport system substrate-binding protein